MTFDLERVVLTVTVISGIVGLIVAVLRTIRKAVKRMAVEEMKSHCDERHKELKEETSGAVAKLETSIGAIDRKIDKWGEEVTGVKVEVAKLVGELQARRNREPV